MAHPPALSAAGLEYRGSLGCPAFAAARNTARASARYSPARQPKFSPASRRFRRLPASYHCPRGFPPPPPACVRPSCGNLAVAVTGRHAFEFCRRPVAQRRVQPPPVVNLIDELHNAFSRLGQSPVFLPVHLLGFQRLHPRFTSGIFPGTGFVTHADLATA